MFDYIGFCKEMTKYCGAVLTIMTFGNQDIGSKQKYFMHETDYPWGFTDEMIEGLADEVVPREKMVSLDKVVDEFRQFIVDYFPNLFRTGEEVKEVMDLFRKRLDE